MSRRPRVLDPAASPAALLGAEVRRRRVEAGLSQAALGRRVHVSGDLIARVEKAERRAVADLVSRLDDALEAGGDLVRLAASAETTRRSAGARTHLDPDLTARALREVLNGLRQLDHGLGSGRAVGALLAHAQLAETMLPTVNAATRRQVLTTLGEVHQLAGWIGFDQGDLPASRTSFAAATAYADAAGDDALAAYVLGPSQGFALTYSGNPIAGLRAGDKALERATRSGNRRLIAFVLAISARAYARAGDANACLTALDLAEDELARHRPDAPDPAWLAVFDEAALRGHRGSCLLDLGEARRSIDLLVQQDSTAPRLFVRNRVIWLLDRARAHTTLQELDAACDAIGRAVDVAAGTSSRRTAARMRHMVAMLDPWGSTPTVAVAQKRLTAEIAVGS